MAPTLFLFGPMTQMIKAPFPQEASQHQDFPTNPKATDPSITPAMQKWIDQPHQPTDYSTDTKDGDRINTPGSTRHPGTNTFPKGESDFMHNILHKISSTPLSRTANVSSKKQPETQVLLRHKISEKGKEIKLKVLEEEIEDVDDALISKGQFK
ncbi:hypothetical protein L1887_31935 [Cichorium endivia]|nr:hypothetical protein L1887_31935 [Cichorium endivia]